MDPAKYEQAPEAFTHHDAPEVVEQAGLEAYTPANQAAWQHEKVAAGSQDYYGNQQGLQNVAAYCGHPPQYEQDADQSGLDRKRRHRICGMKRTAFYWMLLGVIFTVIVIAAVLGGVLGSVLNKSSSSNGSPPLGGNGTNSTTSNITSSATKAMSGSGLSLIVPVGQGSGGSQMYSYFQDSDGNIMENAYSNNSFKSTSSGTVVSVGSGLSASNGTPIAVTSWSNNGAVYRNAYYLDSNGHVMTTNTTGSHPWSTPYNILTGDSALPNSPALAVCSDTHSVNTGLDGVRVYYASAKGYIREVGFDFSESNTPIWHMWATFPQSDANSGVSCALSNNVNHMYLRNSSTNQIQQWTWDYVNVTTWQMGVSGASNMTSGSDVAVTSDGGSTDHIFYQTSDGHIQHALYYGQSLSGFESLQAAAQGSKLTAAYYSANSDDGAMFMYQNATSSTRISFDQVTGSGQQIASGVVS